MSKMPCAQLKRWLDTVPIVHQPWLSQEGAGLIRDALAEIDRLTTELQSMRDDRDRWANIADDRTKGWNEATAAAQAAEAQLASLKRSSPPCAGPWKRMPYVVEVEREGCEQCGAGKQWEVYDREDVGVGGMTFGIKEEAEHVAEMLNDAFASGRAEAGALAEIDRLTTERDELGEIIRKL